LNDAPSLLCLRAEREFLRLLQGDCGTPVGVLAVIRDGLMEMRAQIFDEGRAEPRVAALRSDNAHVEPEALASELFEVIHGR
jgi:porphobilinogen deaminase